MAPGDGPGLAKPKRSGREEGSTRGSEHLDAISIYCPWSSPNERTLRHRLHRAHGAAVSHANRSNHSRARRLYWEAADIASGLVFTRIPEVDLKEALNNLARLFLVAGWTERTEAPDAE